MAKGDSGIARPAQNTYQHALHTAREHFERALQEQETLEERREILKEEIVQLRRTITALSALCNEPTQIENLGITEACWTVMQSAKGPLTTQQVKEGLEELGFDLSTQKNATASVMSVLTRLAQSEKIRKGIMEDGGIPVWIGPNVANIPL